MVTEQLSEDGALLILNRIIAETVVFSDDLNERSRHAYDAVCAILEEMGADIAWVARKRESLIRSETPLAYALFELMVTATNREGIEAPSHPIVTTIERIGYF